MPRLKGQTKARAPAKPPRGWTAEEWETERTYLLTDPRGPLRWAVLLGLKNERGDDMEWKDRAFLKDILCDTHPYQVVKKCTQVGLSTVMIFKVHFMAQVHGYGVIYTLPTYKLLLEFDKTKIEPLLVKNTHVKPTATFNTGIHTYLEGGYVLFRGTMGDQQDISLTADVIVPDEVDRSDQSVVENLESRLMASKYRGQWWFSNPSRPNIGVDKKWQLSDKREWHITCPHCAQEQFLTYWDNVDKELRAYVCRSCHGILSDEVRRTGRWIATDPGQKWHGYHISQMMAPWISAGDIVDLEETKSKEHFYNYVLGLPVIGEGVSVDRSVIMRNVVPQADERYKLRDQSARRFMGVDVGKDLHVCIGNDHGITNLVCLSDTKDKTKWVQLNDLFLAEGVSYCVIDNGPVDKQIEFQRKFPYKVLRCIYDYNEKRKEDWETDRQKGVINVHKTRVIDALLKEYGETNLPMFVDEHDPWLDGTGKKGMENCLTKHWESMYQVGIDGGDENMVKKDRFGNVIRTWENAGPDHFAHANVYWFVARAAGFNLGTGSSFMAGDFKGKTVRGPAVQDDDDDDEPRGPTFYSI